LNVKISLAGKVVADTSAPVPVVRSGKHRSSRELWLDVGEIGGDAISR
jgi:hypothetical protein